ncbi:MAG: hypothetical protein QM270_06600 [Bacillota bacterium]|nr:hypothetical protein [Bacillota bacterium]
MRFGCALCGRGIHKIGKTQLRPDAARLEAAHRDAQQAQRQIAEFALLRKEFHGGAIDVPGRIYRQREAALPRRGLEAAAAIDQLHGAGGLFLLGEAPGHLLRQLAQQGRRLVETQQVHRRRAHRADRAGRLLLALEFHAVSVLAAGGTAEVAAMTSEELKQGLGIRAGEVADGMDREPVQPFGEDGPDKEHALHRQRPDQSAVVLRADDGDGIRFFIVRTELGKGQRKGYADGNREPELGAHGAAYLMGDPGGLLE